MVALGLQSGGYLNPSVQSMQGSTESLTGSPEAEGFNAMPSKEYLIESFIHVH